MRLLIGKKPGNEVIAFLFENEELCQTKLNYRRSEEDSGNYRKNEGVAVSNRSWIHRKLKITIIWKLIPVWKAKAEDNIAAVELKSAFGGEVRKIDRKIKKNTPKRILALTVANRIACC